MAKSKFCLLIKNFSSGRSEIEAESTLENQISHLTITVPIADEKEKSQHDDIELCQGSENRQEFYDSETKRIPSGYL